MKGVGISPLSISSGSVLTSSIKWGMSDSSSATKSNDKDSGIFDAAFDIEEQKLFLNYWELSNIQNQDSQPTNTSQRDRP